MGEVNANKNEVLVTVLGKESEFLTTPKRARHIVAIINRRGRVAAATPYERAESDIRLSSAYFEIRRQRLAHFRENNNAKERRASRLKIHEPAIARV